jgi:hypothetical protein
MTFTNLPSDYFLKRIPFLKSFDDFSDQKHIFFTKKSYNKNVSVMNGSNLFKFKMLNISIEFYYYTYRPNKNNQLFNIILSTKFYPTFDRDTDDITKNVLIQTFRLIEQKLSYSQELISKTDSLPDNEMDRIINEVNKKFFELEEYVNDKMKLNNPLDETKTFIKNKLKTLLETYKAPKFDDELKAISNPFQRHIKPLSKEELNKIKIINTEAKQIAIAYRNAFENNLNKFRANYRGRIIEGIIPDSFKNDKNNINYFDDPTIGDGGMQMKLNKEGELIATNVKASPKMADNPELSSATDAGSYYDYQGAIRYFRINVGIEGKYNENKKYSVFITPDMDAEIKTRVAFNKEIISFLNPSQSYMDDTAKEKANTMELFPFLNAVRSNAEEILSDLYKTTISLKANPVWIEFRNKYQKIAPNTVFNSKDLNAEISDLVQKYKIKNLFKQKKDTPISMNPDELADFEKKEKEKADRLAKFKARKKILKQ